ncbi:1-phosphatidylinositol-4,5-bisphosphate phosphodiesterase [Babesia caballi]|uniref:Phosphoinositide phospholipase C n=1 Tax=Babesia caballi TaxID=5871 RepID=A0AAV4LSR9_BABCB|nr:1-phosphatidylinositol-4,5-bisphosphate phosphodiesterase [Babesia caballi]
MPTTVNEHWMRELAAGNMDVSPRISESLLEEISRVPVAEAVQCVLTGDLLKKSRRGQPLTPRKHAKGGSSESAQPSAAAQTPKHLAVVPAGRAHERFFWVSRLCGTFFLRWQSKAKRAHESAIALCGVDSIRRGDEVAQFDSKGKHDSSEKHAFVLSGAISLRLAASSPKGALLWIAGIYHIARHARDEYARAWITNSAHVAALFADSDAAGIPNFRCNAILEELDRPENALSALIAARETQSADALSTEFCGIDEVVDMLKSLNVIGRTDRVAPIVSAVKEVLETRQMWLHEVVQRLVENNFSKVDNLVRFVSDCAYHLKALDVGFEHSRREIFLYDNPLDPEDAAKLIFNVVKHYSVVVSVSERKEGDDDIHSSEHHDPSKRRTNFEEADEDSAGVPVAAQSRSGDEALTKNKSKATLPAGDDIQKVPVSQGAVGCLEESGPLQPIDDAEYEKFLEKVQGANRQETADNLLEIATSTAEIPITVPKEPKKKAGIRSLFRKLSKATVPARVLTVMGFHWALSQKFNTVVMPYGAEEIENMLKYPLKAFWIASSHNTYLTGNQVGGTATAGALAEALLRGCRCIELDCQGGAHDEPALFHSWKSCQLTGSVTLREALVACKETAFKTSKLPVVFSMQMTCSDECKIKTEELFREILGDQLFVPDPTKPADHVASLPLGCLLSKFIIKGKVKAESAVKNPRAEKQWMSVVALHGYRLGELTPEDMQRAKQNDVYSMKENKLAKVASQQEFLQRFTDVAMIRLFPSSTRLASTNFCPLNAWAAGIQFVAMNYQSHDRSMLINYGKFNQSFGYVLKPPEIRPYSRAPDECLDYFCGGPVALKIHVLSASQLPPPNEGQEQTNFANALENTLRSIQQQGTPLDLDEVAEKLGAPRKQKPAKGKGARDVSVAANGLQMGEVEEDADKVISRSAKIVVEQNDACCPFVEVTVLGEEERMQRTEAVSFNGFNPVWADTSAPFEFVVKRPNLAILLLTVKHQDNVSPRIIGQTAIPVNRIRPGIRWAQLLDQRFMEIDCCGLLLHVEVTRAD